MKALLLTLCFLAACSPQTAAPTLQTGTWTGGLTPMNHPDRTMPLTYTVSQADGQWSIVLGTGDLQTPTRDVTVEGDTISFVFTEPEAGVVLTCALSRQPDASYAGRCTDPDGKWARFTMMPPGG